MAFGLTLELHGATRAIRRLRKLPRAMQRGALHRVVSAGAGQLKKAMKTAAPRESGLLRRSLKAQRLRTSRRGDVNYRVQPGKGYKKAIRRTRTGRTVVVGAKKAEAILAGGGTLRYRNPQRYAHFPELGTRRGVRATHFARKAFTRSRRDALRAIRARARKEIMKAI